ncbi:hypothetical protein [Clostridium sp.]|uniref:hypothetical protein n=1 Tax=Clostridium sp. TaxID=1506 RepID=UPI003D6D2622
MKFNIKGNEKKLSGVIFVIFFIIWAIFRISSLNVTNSKNLGLTTKRIIPHFEEVSFRFKDSPLADGTPRIVGLNDKRGIVIELYDNDTGKIGMSSVKFFSNAPKDTYNVARWTFTDFLKQIYPKWDEKDIDNWIKESFDKVIVGNMLIKDGKTIIISYDSKTNVISCQIGADEFIKPK